MTTRAADRISSKYRIETPIIYRGPRAYGWAIYLEDNLYPFERSEFGYKTAAAANLDAVRILKSIIGKEEIKISP